MGPTLPQPRAVRRFHAPPRLPWLLFPQLSLLLRSLLPSRPESLRPNLSPAVSLPLTISISQYPPSQSPYLLDSISLANTLHHRLSLNLSASLSQSLSASLHRLSPSVLSLSTSISLSRYLLPSPTPTTLNNTTSILHHPTPIISLLLRFNPNLHNNQQPKQFTQHNITVTRPNRKTQYICSIFWIDLLISLRYPTTSTSTLFSLSISQSTPLNLSRFWPKTINIIKKLITCCCALFVYIMYIRSVFLRKRTRQ